MHGGDERTRTADPLLAKQVLSQLSYIPAHGPDAMLCGDGVSAVSLRTRQSDSPASREVLQTLNGLKSGKDKALVFPWVVFRKCTRCLPVREDERLSRFALRTEWPTRFPGSPGFGTVLLVAPASRRDYSSGPTDPALLPIL